jgi:chromosome segregation ATPase
MADQDFKNVLNMYRQNLTEYKLTGNTAFKTASDSAKTWLNSYIRAIQSQTRTHENTIRQFVSQYQRSNPELAEIQERVQKVQKEAPKLQDDYETGKESQETAPIDYTQYYVKIGIMVGVLALTALL